MTRILIVKLSALGDIIHLSWILPALKKTYPDLKVDWVVDAPYEKFLSLFSEVDNVIPLDLKASNPWEWVQKIGRQCKAIRHYSYDAVIDAQGLLRSALITAASRSHDRIGFAPPVAREGSYLFYRTRSREASQEINVVDKNLTLFEKIGVRGYASSYPALNLSHVKTDRVDRYLESNTGKYKIVLNPSASFYTKPYPLYKIPALAKKIREEYNAPLMVLNDGQEEGEREFLDHPDILTAPVFSLEELLVFFRRCDFLIGVDSGPSYIAELVGTPSLILFGPTNLERQSPSQSRDPQLQELFSSGGKNKNLSVYSNYICPIIHPGVIFKPYRCIKRHCSDNLCMKEFDPADIIARVKNIITT